MTEDNTQDNETSNTEPAAPKNSNEAPSSTNSVPEAPVLVQNNKLIARESKSTVTRKHMLRVLAAGVAVTIVATGAFFVFNRQLDTDVTVESELSQQVPLMSSSVTLIDGSAQFSGDKILWQDLESGQTLGESMYIRTAAESRVIITLDDGSAIRLNSDSLVQLKSLHPKNVKIDHQNGEVYARVVTSERSFTVEAGGEKYQAQGTAYKTIVTDETSGVEVYQSSVKAAVADKEVTEGKQYFKNHTDSTLKEAVTDISLEKVETDPFMLWNLSRDKEASEFKDKLGYLKVYDDAKQAEESTPEPSPQQGQVINAGINLSGQATNDGISFSWTLSATTAPNGFKLVASKDGSLPTFGKHSSNYIGQSSARNHTWDLKDGKAYSFRICIYRPSSGSCDTYSNTIQVTAPYNPPEPIVSGPLNLTISGDVASWTVGGTAPQGFKLVMSSSSGPTYPANSKQYISPGQTSSKIPSMSAGTYYIRVCKYTGDSCVDYSNEVQYVVQ